MFKLKLNRRKKSPEQLAQLYAKQASLRRKNAELLITDWLEQDSGFDSYRMLDIWGEYRKKYGLALVEEAIKIMAISNSAVDTNSFLLGKMRMENVSIDLEDFYSILSKIFTLNISNILVSQTSLEPNIKNAIMERIVTKAFPLKENNKSIVTIPEK